MYLIIPHTCIRQVALSHSRNKSLSPKFEGKNKAQLTQNIKETKESQLKDFKILHFSFSPRQDLSLLMKSNSKIKRIFCMSLES